MLKLSHRAVAFAAVATLASSSVLARPSFAGDFILQEATITSINEAFNQGYLTSQKLVQLYLNRIAAYDLPTGLNLNSIISINPNAVAQAIALDLERATSGARSLLHGIPILLKDNIDTSFLPTTGGFLGLKDSLPPDNATITQKLIDAGAIILGKTSPTEFANYLTSGMPAGYNSVNGYTFNPYNPVPLTGTPQSDGRPLLSPGGSSAGSGAAIAANLATIAIGTETSGSILSPSNQNSLVGIKPTVGLWSRDGVIPIAASQDTAGPMAHTVTDAAILLGALTGVDPKDPQTNTSIGLAKSDYTPYLKLDALQGAKLGYYNVPNSSTASGAEQLSIFNEALDTLRSQGATVTYIPFSPPSNNSTVLPYEFKRDLNLYLESLGSTATIQSMEDVYDFINDYLADTTNPNVFKYGKVRIDASRLIDLSPTSADTLKYLDDRALDILNSRTLGIDKFMDDNGLDAVLFSGTAGAGIGAKAGYPTVIVPAGYQTLNNLNPLGLSFLAKAYQEDKLLGYAYDFEQASLARKAPTSTPALYGERIATTPGPLPIMGIGGAMVWSRRLRRRIGIQPGAGSGSL